jgi:acetoin utilization protein AcuB
MLVRDIMTAPPVVISPETTLEDAYRIMNEKQIRHLLVTAGEKLVGVVTDRDLRLATSALSPKPLPVGTRVADVMCHDPVTADTLDPVEDAAFRMRERKIGCLPVMNGGETLAGIITGIDLLDALLRMTGVDKPSGRVEVRLSDRPGELRRLTQFLSDRDLNIHSILSYPEKNAVRIVLRIGSIESRAIANELRSARFDVLWPPEKPWPR